MSCLKSLVFLYAQGLSATVIVFRPYWAVAHWQCFIDGVLLIHSCICNIRLFEQLNFSW